ncbi:hypothetical protein HY478_01150 [Candidatus Uhrbacteria bacterium]|nr:hypothetical protein [Candidatus Uhrbacteria bacterium]
MKILIPHPLSDHPVTLIRRAGYAEHRDRNANEVSYTHRLGPEFYPRFHVYIEEREDGVSFNLHLDQKRPSYGGGTHAHAGEYEGSTVEREARRIQDFIANYQATPREAPKKKGFFSRLFGGSDEL